MMNLFLGVSVIPVPYNWIFVQCVELTLSQESVCDFIKMSSYTLHTLCRYKMELSKKTVLMLTSESSETVVFLCYVINALLFRVTPLSMQLHWS